LLHQVCVSNYFTSVSPNKMNFFSDVTTKQRK